MNKRRVGAAYEDQAAEYLQSRGYEIIERNYRVSSGEIDIIARDGKYLVFVEVKYRGDSARGTALEAVDFRKQRVIVQTAKVYLYRKKLPEDTCCRFDVIGITGGQITHIENSFWGS